MQLWQSFPAVDTYTAHVLTSQVHASAPSPVQLSSGSVNTSERIFGLSYCAAESQYVYCVNTHDMKFLRTIVHTTSVS